MVWVHWAACLLKPYVHLSVWPLASPILQGHLPEEPSCKMLFHVSQLVFNVHAWKLIWGASSLNLVLFSIKRDKARQCIGKWHSTVWPSKGSAASCSRVGRFNCNRRWFLGYFEVFCRSLWSFSKLYINKSHDSFVVILSYGSSTSLQPLEAFPCPEYSCWLYLYCWIKLFGNYLYLLSRSLIAKFVHPCSLGFMWV